jgi:hypothetical protein
MSEKIVFIAIITLVIAAISAAIWAPCWVYSFASQKEIPARCISYFAN